MHPSNSRKLAHLAELVIDDKAVNDEPLVNELKSHIEVLRMS